MMDDLDSEKIAALFKIPIYKDLKGIHFPREILKAVPYSFASKHLILPIKEEGGILLVACGDPLHLEPLEDLQHMLGYEVKPIYCPKEAILDAINQCYNQAEGAAKALLEDMDAEKGKSEGETPVYDLLDTSGKSDPIVKLLNLILAEAINQGASDIHFEPFVKEMKVRYRIDGVLQARHFPATEYQAQLLTRIKVMSKLDIAERRLPQDGRIKLKMGQREIDFRVSTIPVVDGERIVLRILDKGNIILGLDKLGMPPPLYKEFKRLIDFPEGIVLVTGPTGSGKTTTLYSALSDLSNDEVNIMTVEDPIEYNLKGIAQIGVQPKINLTFARGLRHILRQDPDIIMIGEIRDAETAEIAIQAALTGHMVLSTLHTNDAPSAITRLVDMGIEPYLLSSSIVGVLAQRLVRTICTSCKCATSASEEEIAKLGMKENIPLNFFHGQGCSDCFGTGYKGRHALYELMTVNNEIHKQIVKSVDAIEMRKIALASGMQSMIEHGALLVKTGVTTCAEVLRVTRGVDE